MIASSPPNLTDSGVQSDSGPLIQSATPSQRVGSLSLTALILLAVGFRLPAFFLMRYGGTAPDWSDFRYYHELASLAAQGYFPDIHYWVEYPPLFPWLAVGAYRLSLLMPNWTQPYFWFDLFLTIVLATADGGTIVVIDRLGDAVWGQGHGRRAATLYAALFLPVYAILGWFDSLPTFFLLLGLYFGLTDSSLRASSTAPLIRTGAAAGIGAMLKLFPLLALPAAVVHPRSTPRQAVGRVVVLLGSAAATVALIALPFARLGQDTFWATFRNVLARGSWTSPWALLDGYYGTGTVASLPDRLFYNASALWGQPTRFGWLWWLAVAVAGAVYIWRGRVAWREGTARAAVALTGLGVTLLLLLSRGFSTQFTLWVLPFAALLLPDVAGAVFAVLLTLDDVVLEGYLYVTLFPNVHRLLWVSVAVRTVLLLWFALECGLAVRATSVQRVNALRRRLALPAAAVTLAGVVAAAALVGPSLGQAVATRNGGGFLEVLQQANPDVVVFTQPAAYDRLYAAARSRRVVLVAQPKLLEWTGSRSLDGRLTSGVGNAASVVLVTDTSQPTTTVQPAVREWLAARYGAEPERKVESLTLLVYRASLRPAEKAVRARFGAAIDLVGYRPSDLVGHAGAPLLVTLLWRSTAKLDQDYSISVQLLDSSGKLVAQHDGMPSNNARPTSTWTPGQDVLDPVSLSLPAGLAPGRYTAIVVVYDHQSLRRLRVGPDDHAILGTVTIQQ